MFESGDFDNCLCLFPWKRESEAEKEPVSSALGAQIVREEERLFSGGLWTSSTVR